MSIYDELLAEVQAEETPAPAPQQLVYNPVVVESNTDDDVNTLIREIESRCVDIAPSYDDWVQLGFAIESQYGQAGREIYRRLSRLHPDVKDTDIDRQYDNCIKHHGSGVTIKTLFHLAKQVGITVCNNPKMTKGQVVTMSKSSKPATVVLQQTDEDTAEEPLPLFPQQIYDTLPQLLSDATSTMSIQREKDLVLIGSIVALSCCLTPVRTIYTGKTIWPNLYLFVPGPAGSGKGRLDLCWRLVSPIHDDLYELWVKAKDQYKLDLAEYQRHKKNPGTVPPDKPLITMLRVPGNSSATSFNEALAENPSLIMFETEGDTVVNTFKSDYGNYSDSFRKAYAHESFSYLRRGNDGEHKQIKEPKLTALLSGTPEQLKSLVKDAENGLFSRFLFYGIEADDTWRDGFEDDVEGQSLEEYFTDLGARFHSFYEQLMAHEKILFRLTDDQKHRFNDVFRAAKQDYIKVNGRPYSASIHRLAWSHLRVAMILTALRMMDSDTIPDSIYCTDADFDTAMAIVTTINVHNDYIFNLLTPVAESSMSVSASYRAELRERLLESLPQTFESKIFAEKAKLFGVDARTIRRQIDRAVLAGKIVKTSHGCYRKV